METNWSYKDYQVREGLKPGSRHFQYFFVVSKGEEKKCKYCVWIEDDALPRFDPSGDFQKIASSKRGDWTQWVKDKLDRGDFKTVVLRFEKQGQTEVDLATMEEKLSMD